MCERACSSADQDGDKKLTLPEFISLPVGTVDNQQGQDIDDDWVRERKKEFQEVIDANHDGIVTMEELEVSITAGCVDHTCTAVNILNVRVECSRKTRISLVLNNGW